VTWRAVHPLQDFKCVSSLLIAVAALWLGDMARGGQFDHWPCRSVMSAGEGILRGPRSHDHRDGGRDGEAAVAAPRHVVTRQMDGLIKRPTMGGEKGGAWHRSERYRMNSQPPGPARQALHRCRRQRNRSLEGESNESTRQLEDCRVGGEERPD
jgi:hypothetical protein